MVESQIDRKHKKAIRQLIAINGPYGGRLLGNTLFGLIFGFILALPSIKLIKEFKLHISLFLIVSLFTAFLLAFLMERWAAKQDKKAIFIISKYLQSIPPHLIRNVFNWPIVNITCKPIEIPNALASEMISQQMIYQRSSELYVLQKWLIALRVGAPEVLEEYING